MVFGMVIAIIIAFACFPVVMELFLILFVSEEPAIHVNGLGGFGVQILGYKTMCGCIVGLHRGGWLGVPHLLQQDSSWDGQAGVDKQGTYLSGRSGGHYVADYLGDV